MGSMWVWTVPPAGSIFDEEDKPTSAGKVFFTILHFLSAIKKPASALVFGQYDDNQ